MLSAGSAAAPAVPGGREPHWLAEHLSPAECRSLFDDLSGPRLPELIDDLGKKAKKAASAAPGVAAAPPGLPQMVPVLSASVASGEETAGLVQVLSVRLGKYGDLTRAVVTASDGAARLDVICDPHTCTSLATALPGDMVVLTWRVQDRDDVTRAYASSLQIVAVGAPVASSPPAIVQVGPGRARVTPPPTTAAAMVGTVVPSVPVSRGGRDLEPRAGCTCFGAECGRCRVEHEDGTFTWSDEVVTEGQCILGVRSPPILAALERSMGPTETLPLPGGLAAQRPSTKRFYLYRHWAMQVYGVSGLLNRARLPDCVYQSVVFAYPNDLGDPYTGHISLADAGRVVATRCPMTWGYWCRDDR